MMYPLIISAPFGNYLSFRNATSTQGTFTYEYRGGVAYRIWRVARTVRYYHGIGAWKNKLGLPNPGIQSLVEQVLNGAPAKVTDLRSDIVSISSRDTYHWNQLLGQLHALEAGFAELNVSCPNCPGEKDRSDYAVIFKNAAALFADRAILKLPPVHYEGYIETALAAGIRSFHGCNTIPTPNGGLSGKPLKPFSLRALAHLLERAKVHGVNLRYVIGGGGVTSLSDAQDYLNVGATNVAIGSALFFPWRWPGIQKIADHLYAEKPASLRVTDVVEVSENLVSSAK
jgi:dihydroorotate dehydrogenase